MTVHVLIWGDLSNAPGEAMGAGLRARPKGLEHPPDPKVKHGTTCGNAGRDWAEVSSGRSSGECTDALKAKDQRSRTEQHLFGLGARAARVRGK